MVCCCSGVLRLKTEGLLAWSQGLGLGDWSLENLVSRNSSFRGLGLRTECGR